MFTRDLKSMGIFLLVFLVFISCTTIDAYADDSNSVFKTAKTIKIGESISAQLSKTAEKDYYAFVTKAAGSYIIRSTGEIDTVGVLYDQNFKEIKMNDEGDSGTSNFCIVSNLEANRTYYVCVYSYTKDDTGDYQISVVKSDMLIHSFNEYSKNDIIANVVVFNTTKVPIKLSDIKLRYYYTSEGNANQTFKCDYSSVGEDKVIGKFENTNVKSENADTYVEIMFNDKSTVIESGYYTEIKIIIHNSGSVKYKMDNDWSANRYAEEYTINSNITGYLNGTLNWGSEPDHE
ncbi:cellulose binding domain-containing protein [Pseudobacteroides cellulosolvens]|uniref:Type 3a cellulose-binding domain protein n=1 Tax=Pseudobacteroides cellulosolvens ATCC 35603 = DSM 2933 TaxID=398512 RepID=A0A0L6JHN7_9FIRM|nr:cellulose binding domain-containing protein [Pseudobacteroides cellulosolvens]KNY25229.1 type 3a cellulose-binding domain protein [Pseudobacteroides cellulosolvens ATCC 35603 = DSM 2933]